MINEIREYYSEWWENPKDIRNVVFESLNEYIKQRIPLGVGKKALDIGSGHGRIVSYLVEKGYQVSAVEFNEDFVAELRWKFPSIRVISEDLRQIHFSERYDLITCIELVQNLNRAELAHLLPKLANAAPLFFTNISNRDSFHARWVEFRGWRNEFVFNYAPEGFEQMMRQSGFEIVHRRGIGLITPVSLFKNFRGKLLPQWLAKTVNRLDPLVPKICHLYYLEGVSKNC